jgi:hypothetical protein
MSRQEVKDQAARLERSGATVRCVDDGETVVVILEKYTPPNKEAYLPSEFDGLAFVVPTAFPDASPDPSGFFVSPPNLVVATTNEKPRSTSATTLLGQPWLKFSWGSKVHPWNPNSDTLETHLANIESRFHRGT